MVQTDLSCHSELAVCVLDAAGTLLASSGRHADRIGLPIKDVVGRNWREWTPRSEIRRLEPLVAQTLAGTPRVTTILAIRPDKRLAVSQATMLPIPRLFGVPGMMTLHRQVFIPRQITAADAEETVLDVGALIAEMSAEVARSARQGGFDQLSRLLDMLAAQTGELLDRLPLPAGRRPN